MDIRIDKDRRTDRANYYRAGEVPAGRGHVVLAVESKSCRSTKSWDVRLASCKWRISPPKVGLITYYRAEADNGAAVNGSACISWTYV